MRWELLLQDLQSQFDAAARDELDDAAGELTEAEMGRVALADRLRARRGQAVSLRLRGGLDLSGMLIDAAPQWLLMGEGERRILVPMAAVSAAWPLGPAAPPTSGVERRLRVTHALRAVSRQGLRVGLTSDAGTFAGWLVRVGDDHVDLQVDHEKPALSAHGTASGAGRMPNGAQEAGPPTVTVALGSLLMVRTG